MTSDINQLSTGKNVWQGLKMSAEGLSDILFGMPKIIFAITDLIVKHLSQIFTTKPHSDTPLSLLIYQEIKLSTKHFISNTFSGFVYLL